MKWYRKLYMGGSLRHSRSYYRHVIEHTKRVTATYCIMLSSQPDGLLDICRSDFLRIPGFYRDNQLIIGLAGTKRESRELAGQIILDVMNSTGSSDVKKFFSGRRE